MSHPIRETTAAEQFVLGAIRANLPEQAPQARVVVLPSTQRDLDPTTRVINELYNVSKSLIEALRQGDEPRANALMQRQSELRNALHIIQPESLQDTLAFLTRLNSSIEDPTQPLEATLDLVRELNTRIERISQKGEDLQVCPILDLLLRHKTTISARLMQQQQRNQVAQEIIEAGSPQRPPYEGEESQMVTPDLGFPRIPSPERIRQTIPSPSPVPAIPVAPVHVFQVPIAMRNQRPPTQACVQTFKDINCKIKAIVQDKEALLAGLQQGDVLTSRALLQTLEAELQELIRQADQILAQRASQAVQEVPEPGGSRTPSTVDYGSLSSSSEDMADRLSVVAQNHWTASVDDTWDMRPSISEDMADRLSVVAQNHWTASVDDTWDMRPSISYSSEEDDNVWTMPSVETADDERQLDPLYQRLTSALRSLEKIHKKGAGSIVYSTNHVTDQQIQLILNQKHSKLPRQGQDCACKKLAAIRLPELGNNQDLIVSVKEIQTLSREIAAAKEGIERL